MFYFCCIYYTHTNTNIHTHTQTYIYIYTYIFIERYLYACLYYGNRICKYKLNTRRLQGSSCNKRKEIKGIKNKK